MKFFFRTSTGEHRDYLDKQSMKAFLKEVETIMLENTESMVRRIEKTIDEDGFGVPEKHKDDFTKYLHGHHSGDIGLNELGDFLDSIDNLNEKYNVDNSVDLNGNF